MATYQHTPVLLQTVLDQLQPQAGQHIIDGTLGGGGYTEALVKAVGKTGKVLAIDLDQLAIDVSRERLKVFGDRVIFARGNFKDLDRFANDNGVAPVDGVVLDIGLSSGQLQDEARGFSFNADKLLDMRFDTDNELTALEIINTYTESQLTEIFKEYGEEQLDKPIAKWICKHRGKERISTPKQLAAIVEASYKHFYKKPSKMHPATKVFQALRIAVNDELGNLTTALTAACNVLKPGGKVIVISYHSLEDRIVKEFFRREARDCICPPKLMVCQCNHKANLKILTKKPIEPSEEEVEKNPRARSAKMRVAVKI